MCAKLSVTQLKSPILTVSMGQPVHFDSSKNNSSYIVDFFNFCVDLFTFFYFMTLRLLEKTTVYYVKTTITYYATKIKKFEIDIRVYILISE